MVSTTAWTFPPGRSYFSINTEFRHGIDNAQESLHRFGLFADHGFVDPKIQVVVAEVLLHLCPVNVEDVQVHDGQTTAPPLVAVGQMDVLRIEDAIEEGEVVFNLLVALDVETSLGLNNRRFEVRHRGRL